MNFYRFWFGGHGLKALWIALRRAPRDSRARANLIRLILSLFLACAYIAWLLFYFRGMSVNFGWQGNLIVGTVIGGFLLLAAGNALYQRFERRNRERNDPSVSSTLKIDLYREAALLAILLERLASEIGMEKELPEGVEIITRRVLLDRLAQLNLRDGLEPWLLNVILLPDGHWPQDLKNTSSAAWECLSVMRWVLGQSDLCSLTMNPRYKLDDAHALITVKNPEKLSALPSWDIRPARNAAHFFFNRCWSELMARGLLRSAEPEQIERALQARASIQAEGYTADYLIGSRTVPEWPEPLLWQAVVRANTRLRALALLVDITAGERPASDLRVLFAEFFATGPSKKPQ